MTDAAAMVPRAALGLQAVEEIASRLDDEWEGKPADFPDASPFLSRAGQGQRNHIVVYLVGERAGEAKSARGPVVQIMTSEIAIVFLLPKRNDRGGAKARLRAELWVDGARRRLLRSDGPGNSAWQPPSVRRPLAFLGGLLEPHDADENYWVWVDRYSSEWLLDSQTFDSA